MRVEIAGLAVDISGAPIVSGADLSVASGEVVGLIGPNGSGKSTLLRAIYRALKPRVGAVLLGDDDVWRSLSPRQSEDSRDRQIIAEALDVFGVRAHCELHPVTRRFHLPSSRSTAAMYNGIMYTDEHGAQTDVPR